MREVDHTILVFSHFEKRQHLKPVCFKGLKVYLLSENSNKVLLGKIEGRRRRG